MSIPKIIHYCWLSGDPYPDDIKKCIDSWKKFLPDYEVRLWDKKRFDCDRLRYTKEALEFRKYAFVSDVVRLYALYNEGGIYLDSDIEVLRSFDDLLNEPGFSCMESGGRLAAWIMASEKGNPLFGELLSYYDDRSFFRENGKPDLTPNTVPVTRTLSYHGMKPENRLQRLENITIFPEEYFCPKNPWTGDINITENTYAMHLFAGAWNDTSADDKKFFGSVPEYMKDFYRALSADGLLSKDVYIFGAGTVGSLVFENSGFYDINIKGFVVSGRDNAWDDFRGVKIYLLDDLNDKDAVILIATLPSGQDGIYRTLKERGFKNIYRTGAVR